MMRDIIVGLASIAASLALAGDPATQLQAVPASGPVVTNMVATTQMVAAAGMTNLVATNTPVAVSFAPAPAPDPQVGKILMGLAAHLQTAKSFKCSIALQVNTEMEGMKQEISATYDLAAEKPNKLALRYARGMSGNTVVCNGKKLYIYALSLNRFEEREAPKLVEQLAEGVGPMAGNMLFVDNLMVNDIYAAIMDGVTSASYVGKERVDGVECEHLKFVQEQFDWDLWVSAGDRPVVVQVLSDMAKSFSGMTGEAAPPKGMRMLVLNRFSNWLVGGELPPETFEFAPPAGARKTEMLFEGEDEGAVEMPLPPVIKEESGGRPLEKM